jgi:hypothetical protein
MRLAVQSRLPSKPGAQLKRQATQVAAAPSLTEVASMSLIDRFIKWTMLVSGLLTCTMFHAAISPVAALQSTFGESIDGPVAQIVVRSWGVLIGLVGLMLVYGAFNEPVRRMALLVAGASKVAYISLVLLYGRQFLEFQVGTSLVVDSAMVVLFVAYLLTERKKIVA